MAMDPCGLATAIRVAMGFPAPNSRQLIGWATGVIDEITTGVVTNATGTITATYCCVGPISAGTAICGVIACICNNPMAQGIIDNSSGAYRFISVQLRNYTCAIACHIVSCGVVTFASGQITGCATTMPCILVAGAGTCGMIGCLCGPVLAQLIATKVGYGRVSVPLRIKATAMVCYIMTNSEVTYSAGCVTGDTPISCCAMGGCLLNGTGVAGVIS